MFSRFQKMASGDGRKNNVVISNGVGWACGGASETRLTGISRVKISSEQKCAPGKETAEGAGGA